jgi:hypothetical protein
MVSIYGTNIKVKYFSEWLNLTVFCLLRIIILQGGRL